MAENEISCIAFTSWFPVTFIKDCVDLGCTSRFEEDSGGAQRQEG